MNETIIFGIIKEFIFAKFGKMIIPEPPKANGSLTSSLFDPAKDMYAVLKCLCPANLKKVN